MNFASDPPLQRKISQMGKRVRWQHPELIRRGIDQTRLVINNANGTPAAHDAFHFLVLGDSGTGRHRRHSPPRRIAERLLPHKKGAAFLLHTGDVVYLVGAADQYRDNFLKPYREWLHHSEDWQTISHEGLVFNQPFLPVPGNHDYYDLSIPVALLAGVTLPLRRHLQWMHDIDAGWRGSRQGETYARAFLDVLADIPLTHLGDHLDKHYDVSWDGKRCLRYQPGINTRLPNRYYRFRHSGVDVFAIDSNTLLTTAKPSTSNVKRRQELRSLEQQQANLYRDLANSNLSEENRDALLDELETLQEECFDLQRHFRPSASVDQEQLTWLKQGLIASHRDPDARGRILTMHHPAYVTEKTKWSQADTQAIRNHLRDVFDEVASSLGGALNSPLVDLVLSGHAHCMEVLRTHETGHADREINWVICGGSGYGLRMQRREGPELIEQDEAGNSSVIASNNLFIGRNWNGTAEGDAYSGLRIDIAEGKPLRMSLTPLVSSRTSKGWVDAEPAPITLGG